MRRKSGFRQIMSERRLRSWPGGEVRKWESGKARALNRSSPAPCLLTFPLSHFPNRRLSTRFPPQYARQAGSITRDQLREIAQMKMPDLNANDVEAAMNIIAGTARSMGIDVAA